MSILVIFFDGFEGAFSAFLLAGFDGAVLAFFAGDGPLVALRTPGNAGKVFPELILFLHLDFHVDNIRRHN